MHLVERLLDVFEPDAFGNEPLQRQPALQVKVDQRGEVAFGQAIAVPRRLQRTAVREEVDQRHVQAHVGRRNTHQHNGSGEIAGVEGLLVGFRSADGVDHHVRAESIREAADGLDDVDFAGVDGVGGAEGAGPVKLRVIGVDRDDPFGANLVTVDAAETFLEALSGVSAPEGKRKIIGRQFIRAFEGAVRDVLDGKTAEFLVQGTLYPDVVESGGGSGTANIKSHHNVGGLPDDLKFTLVEPLRLLFKDEVRAVGRELGLPEEIVARQPFPGPGLGIRIVGEVTAKRLDTLRHADSIVREELTAAGLDNQIWQCPVVLLADVRSVGVQGDGRTYGHPIVLRPVSSEDAMTADWTRVPYEVLERISTRITNEVAEVNRVVLDITSKPPATIEWE